MKRHERPPWGVMIHLAVLCWINLFVSEHLSEALMARFERREIRRLRAEGKTEEADAAQAAYDRDYVEKIVTTWQGIEKKDLTWGAATALECAGTNLDHN